MSQATESRIILVTGATGYVGGRLVERLLSAGYRVRASARSMDKLKGRSWSEDPEIKVVIQPITLSIR